jgi:hypothetical protein
MLKSDQVPARQTVVNRRRTHEEHGVKIWLVGQDPRAKKE